MKNMRVNESHLVHPAADVNVQLVHLEHLVLLTLSTGEVLGLNKVYLPRQSAEL